MNLTERNLGGTVVSELAGISDSTLRQWRRRGLIHVVDGPNAWPTYCLLETLQVAVLCELKRYGVDLFFGSMLVEALSDLKPAQLEGPLYLRTGPHMRNYIEDAIAGAERDAEIEAQQAKQAKRAKRDAKAKRGPSSRAKGPRISSEFDHLFNDDRPAGNFVAIHLARLLTTKTFSIDPEEEVTIVVDVTKIYRRILAALAGRN